MLADAGRHIGTAVATLCDLLNPELIVVGGELSAAGEVLLDPLREQVHRHAIPATARGLEIVPGVLGTARRAAGNAGAGAGERPTRREYDFSSLFREYSNQPVSRRYHRRIRRAAASWLPFLALVATLLAAPAAATATPRVTANPNPIPFGKTLTVKGRGWPVIEFCSRTVRLSLRSDQNAFRIGTDRVGPRGRFRFTWVPRRDEVGRGDWTLVAACAARAARTAHRARPGHHADSHRALRTARPSGPSPSMSTFSAAGVLPRPGICWMSPHSGTSQPAPV